jgi:hypothetical protein
MTSMAPTPATRSDNVMAKFLKKFLLQITIIFIVIQLSLAASWGWTWLILWNNIFADLFLKIAGVVGSAILAGLISRVILKDHIRIMRWLSAQISVVFSLVILSLLTQNLVGFRLVLTPPADSNWEGVWQFSLGSLITWLVIYSWKSTHIPDAPGSELVDVPVSTLPIAATTAQSIQRRKSRSKEKTRILRQSPRPEQRLAARKRVNKTAKTGDAALKFLKKIKHDSVHWIKQLHFPDSWRKIVTQPHPALSNPPPVGRVAREKINKPTKRVANTITGKAIRLVGMEEHRCPYCLELVEEQDPAGVVICQICHAYHHKNCWDVSGTCQVPHLQK